MGAIIEEVEFNRDPEETAHSGVTCIFCGLPTPAHAPAKKTFEAYPPQPSRRVSLVRCEICGKEAPYLSSEVTEFGEVFRVRRTALVEKEQGI